MPNDADDLVTKAQKQLEEHKRWLAAEIGKVEGPVSTPWMRQLILDQAGEIKLRVVKVALNVVTVVYDYPDELYMFLRSDAAPKHLRDSLDGSHLVDPNQPTFTVKRVGDDVG